MLHFSPDALASAGICSVKRDLGEMQCERGALHGRRLQSHIKSETEGEKLSTLAENNFNNQGNKDLSTSRTYTYTLANGYTAKLSGWTHTRTYAKGFLRNKAGDGIAVVEGLKPGAGYEYKVYQYASKYGGSNPLSVNGVSKGSTKQGKSDAATAKGEATATGDGKITFAFTRKSHHVHLSGLTLARGMGTGLPTPAPTPTPTTAPTPAPTRSPRCSPRVYTEFWIQKENGSFLRFMKPFWCWPGFYCVVAS